MRFRDTIELVSVVKTTDQDGYWTEAETRTQTFADVQSVRRAEFYDSMRAGVAMAVAFVVRACEYAGQERIEYDGKRYKVERAYTKEGELTELNCSEVKR